MTAGKLALNYYWYKPTVVIILESRPSAKDYEVLSVTEVDGISDEDFIYLVYDPCSPREKIYKVHQSHLKF